MRLGEILVAQGRLAPDRLDVLLRTHQQTHHRLGDGAPALLFGDLLVEQAHVTLQEVRQALYEQFLQERSQDTGPTGSAAIGFRNVTKVLDGRTVLDRASLQVPEGKITAIIGMSGGGKSVTLKHMVGLMRPDAGEVLVGTQVLHTLSAQELTRTRQRFSMTFQGSALFDSMNVADNVAFPLRERRQLADTVIREQVQRVLQQVNLPDMGHKFPEELSGGMMKRVALARALVTEPDVLLLDEPTAGLDPIIERSIHYLICDTYMRHRYTMVLISHAVPEIFAWCHHVIVLHQGQVLESGPAADVLVSQHPVTRQFIHGELSGPIKVI
jgi:phospholipid/cholesterol/gamma-HCH transport system ATP-binding protein